MVRKDVDKKYPSFELDERREKEILSNSKGIFDYNPTDENGFSQENTNIYVKKGETAQLVLVPRLTSSGKLTTNPYVVNMHDIVRRKGGQIVSIMHENCLKEFGQDCPLCDAALSSDIISNTRPELFYLVLDTRGERIKEGFDTSKIKIGFINVPTAVFKQIKDQEDKLGDLSWMIFEFKKDSSGTIVSPVMKRLEAGTFAITTYEGEKPSKLPDFAKIYGIPRTLEEYNKLIDYITK